MNMRNAMIGLGGLLMLVSLLADAIGLGREPQFGWKQAVALAIGLGLVVGGAVWGCASRQAPSAASTSRS